MGNPILSKKIKHRLARYYSENNSTKWIDVLDKIVNSINSSVNKTLGVSPNSITEKNWPEIFERVNAGKTEKLPICRFYPGDKVRIPLEDFIPPAERLFRKGYKYNWTKELYTIHKSYRSATVCYFKLRGPAGDILPKSYYERDLNIVIRKKR